ncbi:DAK2 domain fusion protein YloV [Allocatelliglobosispora scoriae]|uniref:DAK2 domain fusion protein YloV n=1 Tax=Allocatelliglobosispora scoriae TaxID=643052 RepID=A0A841BZV7_9ACTN|nr:DAK2 domain-containing protein [Allocatelliglobosispora scoriae]MBB5872191.1 DAK2 domain fusion protein YloV [Allocatelliglobosispora scoriae]
MTEASRVTFDAAVARRWADRAVIALERHRDEIDELNVYPVPDGDTGTNMLLTMAAARDGADGAEDFWDALAHGALLGARGNSGVILAQLLRGLADGMTGGDLAAALKVAARAARSAVSRPVEGTILTVADAAALAAAGDDDPTIALAAARAAAEALARTPEQLPALAAAGVVDAGGRGLVVVLEALAAELSGEEIESSPPPRLAASVRPAAAAAEETTSFGYEVQYLLDAEPDAVDLLGSTLDLLGDSLVIVGGPKTWRVHVHVADVGGAIEAGVRAGRPYQIGVTDLSVQVAGRRCLDPDARGVVVVANGAGLASLFEGEGSITVAANPSTGEVLAAIRRAAAGRVVVLPNDPNTQAVAVAAANEAYHEGVKVRVVPTKSPVQALAALAVRDPDRRFEDDVIAMAEAASACRFAEVTTASREALTMAGHCRPGDVIALVGGEVHLIGEELVGVCTDLLDRLLGGGGEIVTLLLGAGAPADLADDLRTHLAGTWPYVEVQCYDAGQPHYPLIVGVE